jgi:gamma-glutamyltranspeptidase/glutathione hydrolase
MSLNNYLKMKKTALFLLVICLQTMIQAQDLTYHSKGKNGMVVASELAPVQAGLKMLEMGGNAADASVAVILAESVVDYPRFNIGGEVTYMFYNANTQKVEVLSGIGEAPLSQEAIEWYMDNGIPLSNIRAALVPSVVDLCVTALQQYGTLSFAETVRSSYLKAGKSSPLPSDIHYRLFLRTPAGILIWPGHSGN